MKNIITSFLLTLLCQLFIVTQSTAQLENIMPLDSIHKLAIQKRFEIDTTADAIVLWNKTYAHLNYYRRSEEWELTFEKAIKVINPAVASEIAEITLPYGKYIPVKKVYYELYTDNQGAVSKISSTKEDLIKEKISDGIYALKFQIPEVKAGSIIYYRFSYLLPNIFGRNASSWPFRWNISGEYPVLQSEFEIKTRDEFLINFYCQNKKFELSPHENCEKGDVCYFVKRYSEKNYNDTYNWQLHSWSRKNIPALREEPYIHSLANYNETMYFRGTTFRLSDSAPMWESYGKSLFNDNFLIKAAQMEKPKTMLDLTMRIAGDTTNKLQAAKNIYNFLRDSMEMVSPLPSELSTIFLCLDARKGTPTVKQKLAIGMLNIAGIRTFPVLVSPTEDGRLDPDYYYPPTQSTTSILASVIKDSVYYSNPASKISSFGFLTPRYYNGFSWLVTPEGASIYLDNELSYDHTVQHIRLTPIEGDERFNFEIETIDSLGLVSSYNLRWLYLQDSSAAAEAIYEPADLSRFNADSAHVTVLYLNSPDTNIVRISRQKILIPKASDIWYIKPASFQPKRTNEFTSASRTFPIEFSHRLLNKRIFEVILPEGMEAEELPAGKKITFPANGLYFEASSRREGNKIVIQDEFQRNQLTFAPSYYPILRTFYRSMLEDENRTLVLKTK